MASKRHGPVATDDGLGLECRCGYEPTQWLDMTTRMPLEDQDRDIEAHERYVTLRAEEVAAYLAKKQATTFLKEVDNG